MTSRFPKTKICQKKLFNDFQIICISGIIIIFIYYLIQQQKIPVNSTSLQVWYTAQQRVKRPTYINRDHGFCGPCPREKQLSNAWQLTDLLNFISPHTSFLVNIGAASLEGGIYDPTYPLLAAINSSFGALLIDPNPHPALFSAYPKRNNIQIIHDYIWSESIVANIFQKYNITKEFTILKVDIDSYECSLLNSILHANYRPQLIHTEFNPIFTPPLIFMPIYNSTTKNDWKPPLWSNNGPFYGCSLSALSNLLKSYDYILVEVDFWDVIYIRRDLAERFHIQVPVNDIVAYENGFINHSCYSYCRQNAKLSNNHIENAIKQGMNESNLTEYMRKVIDLFAPISMRTNVKHPYIIRV